MEKYPILSKAPISEALIDIRVKVRDDLKIEQLYSIYKFISKEYPNKKESYPWEVKLEFKKGKPPTSSASEIINGYIFISGDNRQIFQARVDGFTFSRLKPYETWENLRDEAYRLLH